MKKTGRPAKGVKKYSFNFTPELMNAIDCYLKKVETHYKGWTKTAVIEAQLIKWLYKCFKKQQALGNYKLSLEPEIQAFIKRHPNPSDFVDEEDGTILNTLDPTGTHKIAGYQWRSNQKLSELKQEYIDSEIRYLLLRLGITQEINSNIIKQWYTHLKNLTAAEISRGLTWILQTHKMPHTIMPLEFKTHCLNTTKRKKQVTGKPIKNIQSITSHPNSKIKKGHEYLQVTKRTPQTGSPVKFGSKITNHGLSDFLKTLKEDI